MTIAIVGGTSGIGLGTARYLKEAGYEVIIGGRRKIQEEINSSQIDVTDEASVESFFNNITNLKGLVFCAGISEPPMEISQFDYLAHEKIMKTNVTGFLLCLKYAYSSLKSNRGSIVAVGSIASRSRSSLSSVSYTTSKYALSGIVNHMAPDFAKDEVRINTVLPSMTSTPMLEKNVTANNIEKVIKNIPMERLASIEDVAKGIEFLLSEKSSYMTGTGLDINGGLFVNG